MFVNVAVIGTTAAEPEVAVVAHQYSDVILEDRRVVAHAPRPASC